MMIASLGVLPPAMACKICGELCRCTEPNAEVSNRFADPDPYDPSEEQFASSLGELSGAAFEDDDAELIASSTLTESMRRHPNSPIMDELSRLPDPVATDANAEDASWKQELSSRLSKYKARRREQLGQSSLTFNFESTAANHVFMQPESTVIEEIEDEQPAFGQQFLAPTQLGSTAPELRSSGPLPDMTELFSQPTRVVEDLEPAQPDVGKLIEFPRSLYLGPAVNPYELAEPVLEAPRILDVPESVPAPPPPLSDIELEPRAEDTDPALYEPVLDVAPLPQRAFSGVMDAILVLAATALFGTIALQIAGPALLGDRRTTLLIATAVPTVFWGMYNYLFLVYGKRTLGMSMAHLHLTRFDGAPARRLRRKVRVFALMLSCLSLGLGLAWAFIDEDQICWHDRITRTYLKAR